MAFERDGLSVLAYANGFTLWHYTTGDSAENVDTIGYFNNASDMINIGDMILTNTNTLSTPAAGILVVSANVGGVINVLSISGSEQKEIS